MKKLAILLNIILCFELILFPIDQSVLRTEPVEASSCSQGMNFDAKLGRCLTAVDTAKVMQATANCDPKDVQCYKNNAKQAFEKDVNEGKAKNQKKDNKFMSVVHNAAAVAAAIYYGIKWYESKSPSTCAQVSYGLIVGAGITASVGEIYANTKHKSNLKKIEKDWDKIVNTNYDGSDRDSKRAHSSAAQSEAFEMLAKAEDSISDNAKTKQKIYTAATLMFSAAAISAAVEMSNPFGACADASLDNRTRESMYATNHYEQLFPSLASTDSFDQFLDYNAKRSYLESNSINNDFESVYTIFNSNPLTLSSPSIDDYKKSTELLVLDEESKTSIKDVLTSILRNISPIPFAHATEAAIATGGEEGFTLNTPVARMGVSLLFAGWSLTMSQHAKSQSGASRNRAEHLRKMKADFEGASATINMCKPEDRSNTGKPECYCYTTEGERNPARSNSSICQKLWSASLGSEQGYINSDNAFTGCINTKNEHDPICACKKSSKGCLNISTPSIQGISTGAFKLINSGITPLNDIANGNFARATASDEANLNTAMRNIKAAEQMLESPQLRKHKDAVKKGMQIAENTALKGAQSKPYAPLANNFSGDIAGTVASLEKEVDKNLPETKTTTSTPGTATTTTAKKSNAFNFDFGTDEQQVINEQVSQVMGQQFDYAQNDINQSQTNIFELLSNRYKRSGMRRLFDEEGLMEADAPASTDISN